MASHDEDRRALIFAQHELDADPRLLRDALAEFEGSLEGLDGRTRRKALLLVAALADHWSRQKPEPGERMSLQIERSPRLRIAARADESALPPAFWEVVGEAVATGLADGWGIEQERSGAWFEIDMIA